MKEPGPFDRILESEPPQERDRVAIAVVGAAILLGLVLLILVLPPVSILDDDNPGGPTGDTTFAATKLDELPPPPAGFASVSPLYDLASQEPPEGSVPLTVSLSTTVADGEPLVFFTLDGDAWREVADAVAVAGGSAAKGELPSLPDNVAVFQPQESASSGRLVLGTLPLGVQIDERAAGVLSTLNPAGFAPAADGSVAGAPQVLPNAPAPVAPTISALSPDEAEAVNAILASDELRTGHTAALLTLARDGEFAGLDIDYRAIDPAQGEAFVSFIRSLSAGLRSAGKTLTLTLPLPVRNGDDWDTLGYDWEALGPMVDAIKLAPEPDQTVYYARMEDALEFLVPRVGSQKLVLTIGPLSRERSVDGIRTLPLTEALSLASTPVLEGKEAVRADTTVRALGQNLAAEMGASGLHWDDVARALSFTYTGPGGDRTVWIANAFSEAFKLDLARRFQLGGVAVEDVSRGAGDANIWPVAQRYATTGAVALAKPNGSLLEPRWSASAGTLESDTGAAVSWRAPAEAGTHTLTLVVSDGVVRMGQELRVTVEPPAGALAP